MPYCKSVAIHGHVDKTLRYILDPDKTEELLYTTSINCMTEAELAYEQMKAVYEQYSRRSYDAPQSKSGKSAVKAIHYIISFADSENVTPELAHKIAKALVRKNFGEDAQAVIATHTNTDHVHCHILVNSYSISGQRFYDNKKSLRIVRETTNGICRVFGVTPALNFENKGRSNNNAPYGMNNDLDIYRLSAQLAVINRDGITSIGDLEGRISRLTADYKTLQAQLSQKLLEQEDDSEMSSEIMALKNSFAEKKNKIAIYSDIRETYDEISRGDYISKLVEEEKVCREQEKNKERQKAKKKKGSR